MRITELFTAQSIALDVAAPDQAAILDKLVELQATHGNITDKDAYKKALYAREAEASTYVDNGITVPHARTACVTRPSLAALRLSAPVQYNPDDDGKTDLLFAIAAPENGSLHIDMLARMMQMLMNDDFVEKLRAAKTPAEFLDAIDAQEDAQFGEESFTQQEIRQSGYRVLAVTACPNGIAHTYMAAEALTKMGDKLGLPTKVETNGSDGAKNVLTPEEIAACDGIIIAADKNVETARFDGKPVIFARVDDGIHKPEELIKKIAHGEAPIYRAEAGAKAQQSAGGASDSLGHSLYKHLMNGVSHMLPFVVGGGIMIALAFLLDDYTIDPSNFGMNTPVAAFFKTVGNAAFGYMLPILAGFIAMSIADRPGLAVGFAGGVLAMNGTNFAGLASGDTTGISGGFLAALLAAAVLPAAGHEGMFQVHSPWQTEDSPQIAGETLEVQVEEAGRMTIRYFIAGKGQVEALGAEEIVIRHKVGGVWMETVRYDRKTDELWTEGTMEYGGEISYQGRPGERYQVEVLFFAENEAGYDSRRQTWEVTAE